ncbi:MAG: flagellar biosynthetic protein FliR [Desulfohalobiaceae bacterium]
MDLFSFDPTEILSFLLTLLRISLLVFLLPFFGGENAPKVVKAALCLVLTLGLWPYLNFPGELFPATTLGLAIMAFGEVVLGMILGLVVRIFFAGVQTAGQLIGFQMGFAMMNVVDPMTGVQVTLTSQFLYLMTLLLFLSLNGHLYMLHGLGQSFELVQPGELLINPEVSEQILGFSSQIFVLGVKISAPIIAAVFLVHLALGIMAKIAPQVNVLFVGFPLKIGVGLFFLGTVFNILAWLLRDFVGDLLPLYQELMLTLGQG